MITLENLAEYGRDVFFYYGSINRSGYNQISDCLEKIENKSSAVCLVLSTTGGDADAAYRIARALRYYYKEFDILIPGLCKSAGTLLAIGANRLVFGDRGELGPLDIQLSKPDEMFENMSGLDIIQAISAIESGTLRAFKRYLFDIRGGSGIRTKMAAEIAVQLAEKCFAPMVAKIDPVTLGEHQRAMQIAIDYGERLNEQSCNLKEGALERLVSAYPCHGFVIDRRESRTLFKEIVVPEGPIANIYHWARNVIGGIGMPSMPMVADVNEIIKNISGGRENEYQADRGTDVTSEQCECSSGNDEQAVSRSGENKPIEA